jgi:hypothetical protein
MELDKNCVTAAQEESRSKPEWMAAGYFKHTEQLLELLRKPINI